MSFFEDDDSKDDVRLHLTLVKFVASSTCATCCLTLAKGGFQTYRDEILNEMRRALLLYRYDYSCESSTRRQSLCPMLNDYTKNIYVVIMAKFFFIIRYYCNS